MTRSCKGPTGWDVIHFCGEVTFISYIFLGTAPVLKGRPRRKKKLKGVPLTSVLKKKKFLADIQNCLSEDQRPIKKFKSSDEEDTESDRSEASTKSFESVPECLTKMSVQKQGPPPLLKPPVQIKTVKINNISEQNGRIKNQQPLLQQSDAPSKVPPLIPANKAKQNVPGAVPKLCVSQGGEGQALKQISTSSKTDLKPPPLSSFAKSLPKSVSNVVTKQEFQVVTKKEECTARSSSLPDSLTKPKAMALAVSTGKGGIPSSRNSEASVTSCVTTGVKVEVKSESNGRQLRCRESQGTLGSEKDMKQGKENVKELVPKKRKRLRQPGDLKDGLEVCFDTNGFCLMVNVYVFPSFLLLLLFCCCCCFALCVCVWFYFIFIFIFFPLYIFFSRHLCRFYQWYPPLLPSFPPSLPPSITSLFCSLPFICILLPSLVSRNVTLKYVIIF